MDNIPVSRILRTILGIMAMGEAYFSKQWLLLPLGLFFFVQGVMNWGCCATTGCEPRFNRNISEPFNDEVVFEEIK
jgi:hypothetical protein